MNTSGVFLIEIHSSIIFSRKPENKWLISLLSEPVYSNNQNWHDEFCMMPIRSQTQNTQYKSSFGVVYFSRIYFSTSIIWLYELMVCPLIWGQAYSLLPTIILLLWNNEYDDDNIKQVFNLSSDRSTMLLDS